ncbi:hypothetical protein D9M73_180040 [compost metagenome]
MIALAGHGGGHGGEFTGVVQPVTAQVVSFLVELAALAFQGFEALLQRRAFKLAHDFLEGPPRLPVAAPEVAIEHGFDPAQGNFGVPDRHQCAALGQLALADPQLLPGNPGQCRQRQRPDHPTGGVEKHQGLVQLIALFDTIEITGGQQAQGGHGTPETDGIGIFHCAIPLLFFPEHSNAKRRYQCHSAFISQGLIELVEHHRPVGIFLDTVLEKGLLRVRPEGGIDQFDLVLER